MESRNSITLLRNRSFLKLWTAQTVSELGSRITREGVPYTAALLLNATPGQMGALSFVGGIAVLIFGPLAGVSVDRMRRRPIMITTDLGRALLLATIPVAAMIGHVTMAQLYAVAAMTGVLTVFFDVAYQSYLPVLVDRERVLEGNSKLAMSSSAAEIAGPALTGLLVQLITAPLAIAFDALSFIFSALCIGSIRHAEPVPEPHAGEGLWEEVSAGMRFLFHNPVLRPLAIRSGMVWMLFGLMGPLYVIYALRALHLSPALLGLVIATGGVGALIGSAVAAPFARRFGVGWTFVFSGAAHALASFLIPLAHGSPASAAASLMAAQLLGDSSMTIYYINEVSLRQRVASDRLLGRVNAAMQLLSRGLWPFGALLGGVLAEKIGMRATLSIAPLGALLSVALLMSRPLLTVQAMEAPAASSATDLH